MSYENLWMAQVMEGPTSATLSRRAPRARTWVIEPQSDLVAPWAEDWRDDMAGEAREADDRPEEAQQFSVLFDREADEVDRIDDEEDEEDEDTDDPETDVSSLLNPRHPTHFFDEDDEEPEDVVVELHGAAPEVSELPWSRAHPWLL